MAGRIPQDFIDELLNRTDIVDVVEERITLKRAGRNYSGLCPFHKEKTPSFSVNPDKQFYYCFGCGAGGNALGFVMEHDRSDFPQAVELLARRLGLEVPQENGAPRTRDKSRDAAFDLLQRSADYYRQQLRNHPQRNRAVNYLKERGLSGRIAQQFGIGYAPPGWDNLLKHLQADTEPAQRALDSAGLVVLKPEEAKCYDRFRDRIMFPIVDMRGRVIAFGGRVLNDEKPKYLNSPETETFHKNRELYGLYQARQANRELRRILIVEGYMDVVALAQFGITNTVATLGTATSAHHLTRLYKLVSDVVFCFDGDNAGRQAARRALETALPLMEDGRQARFLFLPEGDDPDSLVRRDGREALEQRIDAAQPLSGFFFAAMGEGLTLDSGEDRARLSSLALPLIEKIPGAAFRQLMKQQLSELTGLDSAFFEAHPGTQPAPPPPEAPPMEWSEADYYYEEAATAVEPAPPAQPAQPAFKPGRKPWKKGFGRDRDRDWEPTPPPAVSSTATKALRWLLHFPKLALKVDFETTEILGEIQQQELTLLKALIEQLRGNPAIEPAVLLLEWLDSPYYPMLKTLIEEELLVSYGEQLEQEFVDSLHHLVQKSEEAKLDYLKTKKASQLTLEERQLLSKLLMRDRPSRR